MIYEERDYHVKPGKLATFVGLYRNHGVEIQKKHLGTFFGYFTSEIGTLNHVVALWGYEGLDDRMERRRRMLADPQWQEYMAMVDGLLDEQKSRILVPTDFSPMQ